MVIDARWAYITKVYRGYFVEGDKRRALVYEAILNSPVFLGFRDGFEGLESDAGYFFKKTWLGRGKRKAYESGHEEGREARREYLEEGRGKDGGDGEPKSLKRRISGFNYCLSNRTI